MIDPCNNTTKVQFGKGMSWLGLLTDLLIRDYLKDQEQLRGHYNIRGSSQHGWRFTKAGTLEFSALLEGSLTGYRLFSTEDFTDFITLDKERSYESPKFQEFPDTAELFTSFQNFLDPSALECSNVEEIASQCVCVCVLYDDNT